jgi:hypothetical protein
MICFNLKFTKRSYIMRVFFLLFILVPMFCNAEEHSNHPPTDSALETNPPRAEDGVVLINIKQFKYLPANIQVKKGTKVLLEGQVDVKQYQRQDGTQGVGMTFRVSNLTLLGGNKDGQQQQTVDPINNAEVPISGGDDSGLPF